jgi:O-6-methylguanine DNA methyltransferase
MLAVATARGIVRLEFDRDDEADPPRLETDGQSAIAVHLLNTLTTELTEYFAGNRTQFSVPVDPSGSDFAQKAWAFLRQIPFGQTRSYGAQARAIAGPNAARAVGRANGSNPIAIVIPCHRVIGADGSLTGFSSGIERKRWLLDHERKNRPSADPMLFPA